MHSNKTKINSNNSDEITPEGEVTFKGLSKEQLKDFILIPGDAKEGQILKATPVANDIVYQVDGVYPRNFTNKEYWFKVANGNSATISFSNTTGKYTFLTTTSYINPLRYLGFVGFLSKIEDHGKTGLGNPFDRNR